MNKQRRKQLAEAIEKLEQATAMLEEAKEIIDGVTEEEQEAFDNMPESLQCSERGVMTQDNVDTLEEIAQGMDSYIYEIEDQIERLRQL